MSLLFNLTISHKNVKFVGNFFNELLFHVSCQRKSIKIINENLEKMGF